MCLKIKEHQVEKIFELIVNSGSTELLGLLKAIAKVSIHERDLQYCTSHAENPLC